MKDTVRDIVYGQTVSEEYILEFTLADGRRVHHKLSPLGFAIFRGADMLQQVIAAGRGQEAESDADCSQ